MIRRWSTRFAPLVAVCAAGCFATRNDVRLVQTNVLATQAQLAQLISTQQAEVDRARQRAAQDDSLRREERIRTLALLNVVSESLAVLSERVSRDRAATGETLDGLNRQILVLQQISGASQKQLRDALAQIERRSETPPPSASSGAKPDSSTAAAAAAVEATPGPAQLLVAGRDMIQKGSYSTGRMALQELVTKYGTSAQAPGALVLIGDSFAREANEGAADSVYQLVVARYTTSDAAPTAVYKRANALRTSQPKKARELYQHILAHYRTSIEAALVPDRLRTLPPG